MSQHRYLCSIPIIHPSAPENETANELARAAEAREQSRAAAHGWNLLSELEETCLYFGSGWWTYSFCNNREIVQYHALPAPPSADKPPKRDPRTAAFTLGREPAIPAQHRQRASVDGGAESEAAKPLPAELQITGDHQRYLVQKLERGDVCDLTGRERTIEVQYQCKLGLPHDKIGYIKEVTICAYLMVIYTPRLCNDVAFLPREEPRANPINCQLVVHDVNAAKPALLDATIPNTQDRKTETGDATEGEEVDASAKQEEPINIGGILVGARNVLSAGDEAGKPPTKLNPPSSYFPAAKKGKKTTAVVARGASTEDGGKVEVLSKAEIEELGLSFEVIEEMREQLEKLSAGKGWKLEVVQEEGGERELRGWIYGLDGEEGEKGDDWYDKDQYDDDEKIPAEGGGGGSGDEGSEEKFKDEL
jgi:protein OS-9